jgi:multidrug efflux pump subunit AcrA (membrane-fusion protein)
MGAIISHASRRKLVWLALAVAAAIGISVWKFQSGAAAPASPLPVVSAIRGDVIVTVGGVGRIVQARGVAQVVVPTAVGGGAATSGSAAGGSAAAGGAAPSTGNSGSAPADAVFAHASGHLSKLLVTPGQRVSAGQVVALIDDAGSSLAAVKQAQNDLATARVELQQKRTSDPLKGFPASPAELAAGRLAVV